MVWSRVKSKAKRRVTEGDIDEELETVKDGTEKRSVKQEVKERIRKETEVTIGRLNEPEVQVKIGFFYLAYRAKYFYFELIDLLHKLFLVAIIGFIPGQIQAMIGAIVAGLYLMLLLILNPYLSKGDNRTHVIAQTEIVLVLLCAHMLSTENVEFLDDSQDKLFSAGFILLTAIVIISFFIHNQKWYRRAKLRVVEYFRSKVRPRRIKQVFDSILRDELNDRIQTQGPNSPSSASSSSLQTPTIYRQTTHIDEDHLQNALESALTESDDGYELKRGNP